MAFSEDLIPEVPEHWINMKRVSASGESVEIIANESQLTKLAEHLGVLNVENMKANLALKQGPANGVVISGEVFVRVEQTCSVTLDPLYSDIQSEFTRAFVPETQSKNFKPEIVDGEMVFDPEADDLPDIIAGDLINLWDVLIEEMNLEIDPYPRSDNATIDDEISDQRGDKGDGEETSEQTHRPFAALEMLLNEKKSKN